MKTIKNRSEIGNIANVTYLLHYVNIIENDISDLNADISYYERLVIEGSATDTERRLYRDYCERVDILEELSRDIAAYVFNSRKVWFNE